MGLFFLLLGGLLPSDGVTETASNTGRAALALADPSCRDWPNVCPGTVPRSPYKQTWLMNLSTIIMPCNYTGYTDPASTKGWGIVDFDWSNSKGRGTADGWAKHKPMCFPRPARKEDAHAAQSTHARR
jgi:hypothetical protein